MRYRFLLAPMSPLIRWLTIALWVLPLCLGGFALIAKEWTTGIVSLLLIAIYGAVWIWFRPAYFELCRNHLEIKFPGWRRRIPISDVSDIRVISQATFRREAGWAMRIGAGGLWGGFGWLWTSRRGLLEFYISRLDRMVFIERFTGYSILITPENAEQMVETIQGMVS